MGSWAFTVSYLFETIDRHILLYTLQNYEISGNVLKWFVYLI